MLVSVIIPCYNQSRFLNRAIKSVIEQSYGSIEIIVVDDGSTEDIKNITDNYSQVIFIRQDNQGLPAARNTGIRNSNGNYLLFLDADDWLYPDAIDENLKIAQNFPDAVMVSGAYDLYYENTHEFIDAPKKFVSDVYISMLQSNFIDMIATVLFKRSVFDEYLFNENLQNCEDYDLYLKLTRHYPIHLHDKKIAIYSQHDSNMSNNPLKMVAGALTVLKSNRKEISNLNEISAYIRGLHSWKVYYGELIFKDYLISSVKKDQGKLLGFLRRYPFTFLLLTLKLRKKIYIKFSNSIIYNYLPNFSLRILHNLGLYKKYVPKTHRVNKGDFERLRPFSDIYGYDRGGPIDRYYIENFLKNNKKAIRGRVLEIKDNAYTKHFGAGVVTSSEILDIDEKNPDATIIGDLQHLPDVPDNSFDCIILTQTLHLIFNVDSAIKTCHRILKPGGSLLITAPGIVPVGLDNDYEHWYWSFNVQSMKRLLHNNFPVSRPVIESYGNIFTATAFLYGMGLPEIQRQQLEYNDKHYPVSICALVNKENS